MAKRIPRASVPDAGGNPLVPGDLPDRARPDGRSADYGRPASHVAAGSESPDEVMLKLLHTADWHLGRRFKSFPEDAQKKLSRARMDVVTRILDVARRNAVHAVLCAGDIFDDPAPTPDFWEGLASKFEEHAGPHAPLFLVPGNHVNCIRFSSTTFSASLGNIYAGRMRVGTHKDATRSSAFA